MRTDFLFAEPSYLTGLSRLLDLRGSLDRYNVSRTPLEADLRALRSDWAVVKQDLNIAVSSVRDQAARLSRGSR